MDSLEAPGLPGSPNAGLFRLTDTAVITVLMTGAFLATTHPQVGGLEHFLALRVTIKNVLLFAAFLLAWQAISAAANRGRTAWTRWSELVRVAAACTAAALMAASVPIAGLSRSFGFGAVLLFWTTSVPAVLATRRVALAVRGRLTGAVRARQVLIVGSGPRAYAVYHRLRDHPGGAYHVHGFVDTNTRIEFPEIRELTLGAFRDLESILMHRDVDLVVIALPIKSQYARIQEAIRVCERVGVESRYPADLFHRQLARQEYVSDGGLPSLAMKVVDDDARIVVKRILDVSVAFLALVALAPVFAAVALAVRVSSPGPVFFAQERYGLNRRIFRMYKFRTMVANAEALQVALEDRNEASGPVFKIRNDPRVTPVGAFLRRTSLDELPQLVNVLKGDMSLVGPRPLPLRDVKLFSEGALMRRFSVLPGLTGLWQVSGRGDLGFDDWIHMDLRYIDEWSLPLDLKILLLTIPAVLRGAGAW